jgi:hypothetical protein
MHIFFIEFVVKNFKYLTIYFKENTLKHLFTHKNYIFYTDFYKTRIIISNT